MIIVIIQIHFLFKYAFWEPGLGNVYQGVVEWSKQSDMIEFDITLYKNMNEDHFEEKEWILMVEDVRRKKIKFFYFFFVKLLVSIYFRKIRKAESAF